MNNENIKEYLYILDYCANQILELELDEDEYENYNEDTERLLKDYGLDPDGCSWMWSSEKLELEPLNKY